MSPGPTDTTPVERPDLKRESLFFETVKSIGIGAVVGVAFTLVGATVGVLTKGRLGTKSAVFGEGVGNLIVPCTTQWATLLGLVGLAEAVAVNDDRQKIRPYVEKLERERESLVQDVIKNNPR